MGCLSVSERQSEKAGAANLGHHADDEAFLLDAVGLDGIGILQNLAWLALSATASAEMPQREVGGGGAPE